MAKTFLEAEWRKLIMVNYSVNQEILRPYLPYQTEIDLWKGTCYVSLVGFMFLKTSVKGFKIPFHTNFEEVNLRFYVKHLLHSEWKRGVVFIKEIVPKPALAFVANTVYNENYETMSMDHSWSCDKDTMNVEYRWKKKKWNSIRVSAHNTLSDIMEGSEEEFITEHYWGYTKVTHKITSEYEVEHPRWKVHNVKEYHVDVDFRNVYGSEFDFLKNEIPQSVFLAEGSEIKVKEGKRIRK